MNKTLNINLGGLIFHVDEDAYKSLDVYLSKIKSYLKNEEGAAEIIQDIESRIAELFREWKKSEEVIGQVEVNRVQELLGRPEDYLVDEENTEDYSKNDTTKTETQGIRKLFRDTEKGMIGGVCAGIANYFSIERMWVRLIAILLLIGIGWIDFGGTTFLTYIILWVIIPEAKTTTEKLQMHGKPINLENIKESVEELSQNIQDGVQKSEPHIRNLGDFIIKVVKIFVKIILVIIGVSLLLWAFGLLIAFLATLSGLLFGEFEYFRFFERVVQYDWQYYAWVIVVGLVVISLLILIIKLGLKLINRRLKWHRGFTIGIVSLFFLSLFVLISLAINQASYYSYDYDLEKEYTLPANDSIAIPIQVNRFQHEDLADYNGVVRIANVEEDYYFDENDALVYKMNKVDLRIKKSPDDKIHLINQLEASGRNRDEALKNVKAIEYTMEVDSTQIKVSDHITIPKENKWRGQETNLILQLPVGQKVKLSYDFYLKGDLINFERWDKGEMRTWQMTEEGFLCLDCIQDLKDFDEDDFGIYSTGKEVIHIDSNGIHISDGEDNHVIIDEKGINIRTEGKDVIKIDANGTMKEEIREEIKKALEKEGVKVEINID